MKDGCNRGDPEKGLPHLNPLRSLTQIVYDKEDHAPENLKKGINLEGIV